METDPKENGAAAVNTDPAANDPVLNPEPEAEGAAAGGEGEGEAGGNAPEGGSDDPILNPEAGDKAGADGSEFVGAPEAYDDFSLPEGFTLDEEQKAQVTELFKGLNLSQKGGQKLVDAFTERMTAQKEAELNALADKRKQWRAAIRQRPNYAAERALAQKGLRAVVSAPEEVAMFKGTWMSDHPALFNIFVKVGRLLGEDTPLPQGGSTASKETATSRFPIKL